MDEVLDFVVVVKSSASQESQDLELLKRPLKMPWSGDAPGNLLRGRSGVSLGAVSVALDPAL